MGLIHLSAFMSDWLDGLPSGVRLWLLGASFLLSTLLLLFLLFRLARQEYVTESGKVVVNWFHPLQWLARFQQIKADNHAKLPESTRAIVDRLQLLLERSNNIVELGHEIVFLVVGCLGLLGVLLSILMNPLKAWWLFVPSAIAVFIGYKAFHKLRVLMRIKFVKK